MKVNRRSFLGTIATTGAGFGLGKSAIASPLASPDSELKTDGADDRPVLQIGDNIAIADTAYGKVRGFILNGIYAFRGITYGADTSGDKRFLPPQPPANWSGIRPAVWWGNSAPQDMTRRYADPYQDFVDHWNYDEITEDCLRLNLWTPALSDGKRRPVLVWLHGGGFTAGNGIEQDGYNGENFSRFADVVFCSLNHRLGVFGFSNFAGALGDKFAQSGNVGMLDIVAALEWIRDNIANFGGDPGNVTIIGQSGGGAKVCALTAMKSAQGLFHKAVSLSGSMLHGLPKNYTERLGERIVKEAGVNTEDFSRLQEMPWAAYQTIALRVAKQFRQENGGQSENRGDFAPVADGLVLPEGRFYPDAGGLSSKVPMIVSTTLNESSPSRTDSTLENISFEQVKEKLRNRFNEATGNIVDAYAKSFPQLRPIEIWSLVASNRQAAIALADAKSRQAAPVYVAWFGWQPPLFDGRMRAFHCSDISFWFLNTDRMYTHSGGGARPRKLSRQMAIALRQFMQTGCPDGGDLPPWPPYTSAEGKTMVLNDLSEVKNDPDREARRSLPSS